MALVYLAGPIGGLSYLEAAGWRMKVQARFVDGMTALSPLRGADHLHDREVINPAYDDQVVSSPRGIMTRCYFDVATADAVFVNLLGAKRVSVGTVMEIAWAYQLRKPVICCIEPEGNPHDHPMVTEATGFRCETLEQGCEILLGLLRPHAYHSR